MNRRESGLLLFWRARNPSSVASLVQALKPRLTCSWPPAFHLLRVPATLFGRVQDGFVALKQLASGANRAFERVTEDATYSSMICSMARLTDSMPSQATRMATSRSGALNVLPEIALSLASPPPKRHVWRRLARVEGEGSRRQITGCALAKAACPWSSIN